MIRSQKARAVFKLVFVGGLLYFLAKKGFLSIEAMGRAFSMKREMASAFGFISLATIFGIWRWQILLLGQGIRLPFGRVAELSFIGIFFNLALPGAVSGDFVKAFYVGKESEGRRAHAFSSIFFDRVTGLAGLVLVSSGALLVSLYFPYGERLFSSLEAFVLIAGAGAIAFYGYLFLVPNQKDIVARSLQAFAQKVRAGGSVLRIYDGIRVYREKPGAAFGSLVLSIVIHACVIGCFVNLAAASGETGVPLLGSFVVVPLGLLVTAIPVAPAGVGTGHAAYLALFHLFNSERGADIFSLFVLMNLCLGAIGGLTYLRFRSVNPSVSALKEA